MVHAQELDKRGVAFVQPKMGPPFLISGKKWWKTHKSNEFTISNCALFRLHLINNSFIMVNTGTSSGQREREPNAKKVTQPRYEHK